MTQKIKAVRLRGGSWHHGPRPTRDRRFHVMANAKWTAHTTATDRHTHRCVVRWCRAEGHDRELLMWRGTVLCRERCDATYLPHVLRADEGRFRCAAERPCDADWSTRTDADWSTRTDADWSTRTDADGPTLHACLRRGRIHHSRASRRLHVVRVGQEGRLGDGVATEAPPLEQQRRRGDLRRRVRGLHLDQRALHQPRARPAGAPKLWRDGEERGEVGRRQQQQPRPSRRLCVDRPSVGVQQRRLVEPRRLLTRRHRPAGQARAHDDRARRDHDQKVAQIVAELQVEVRLGLAIVE
eukprot:7376411-Prymnesium_polylepis.1